MKFIALFFLSFSLLAQSEQEDLVKCAKFANQFADILKVDPNTCARDEKAGGFERIEMEIDGFCGGSLPRDGYDEGFVTECKSPKQYPDGYVMKTGPGNKYFEGIKSPFGDSFRPIRSIKFASRNHALNKTFLYIQELAGGPDSYDPKTVIFLLPRKFPPTVNVQGSDVIITMTTGEKVVFDKVTGEIKSGALKEGKPDFNPDRFKRLPPNVHYSGVGVSIRLDHRYLSPTQGADVAEIQQGSRTCKIPRTKLFDKEGDLMTKSDASLMSVINLNCPAKPGQPAFRL